MELGSLPSRWFSVLSNVSVSLQSRLMAMPSLRPLMIEIVGRSCRILLQPFNRFMQLFPESSTEGVVNYGAVEAVKRVVLGVQALELQCSIS